MDRRNFVATASGFAVIGLAGCINRSTDESDDETEDAPPSASVVVADQLTEGRSITVRTLETEVAASLVITTEAGDEVGEIALEAGDGFEDRTVDLDETLAAAQEIRVQLVHDERGVIEESTATVDVAELDRVDSRVERGEYVEIEAAPEFGFEYPYFLYVPSDLGTGGGPILVEPNETREPADSFSTHRAAARDVVESGPMGRSLSDTLVVPLLVPAFPWPETGSVDSRHYVQTLDAETMAIDDGKLARVDRQLLRMVDHARAQLSERSYAADEEILMHGLGASGTFVNRFTALHPNRVRSVTAGAFSGTAILPRAEADGQPLPFPIGVDNVESLTGTPFDAAAWAEVAQFVFVGSDATIDRLLNDDAWSETHREIGLDVYGADVQDTRMPYCESVYDDAGAAAQFHVFDGAEHSKTRPIMDNCVQFHRRNMERNAGIHRIDAGDTPAADVELSLVEPPRAGATSITVDITIPTDVRVYDRTISMMVFDGVTVDYSERLEAQGVNYVEPGADGTRTIQLDATAPGMALRDGQLITIGLVDNMPLETVTVEVA